MNTQPTLLSGPLSVDEESDGSSSSQTNPHAESVDSTAPETIGPYTLLELIGEGTNGRVYRARRPSDGETVALKHVCLSPEQIESKGIDYYRERIMREARTLDRLRSPHIVGLLDFIEISPEDFGIVMEYAEGPTLHELLCSVGRLGIERAIALAIQIAGAMERVHRTGTIHRDIKPSNIIVSTRPDGSDFVRLLDFGTVRGKNDATITRDFIGTPLYASPEQFRNNRVGPTTDIYALGALIYHMVVGEPPYVGTSIPSVVRMHICHPVPSMRCQKNIQVPAPLDALVTDMLQKSHSKRPATMGEVVRRLARVVSRSEMSPPAIPPATCRQLGNLATTLDNFDGRPRIFNSMRGPEIGAEPAETDQAQVTVLHEQGGLKALKVESTGIVHLVAVGEGNGRVVWSSSRAIDLVETSGSIAAVAARDGTLVILDLSTERVLVEVRHDRPLADLKLDGTARAAIAIRNDGVRQTIPWDERGSDEQHVENG